MAYTANIEAERIFCSFGEEMLEHNTYLLCILSKIITKISHNILDNIRKSFPYFVMLARSSSYTHTKFNYRLITCTLIFLNDAGNTFHHNQLSTPPPRAQMPSTKHLQQHSIISRKYVINSRIETLFDHISCDDNTSSTKILHLCALSC